MAPLNRSKNSPMQSARPVPSAPAAPVPSPKPTAGVSSSSSPSDDGGEKPISRPHAASSTLTSRVSPDIRCLSPTSRHIGTVYEITSRDEDDDSGEDVDASPTSLCRRLRAASEAMEQRRTLYAEIIYEGVLSSLVLEGDATAATALATGEAGDALEKSRSASPLSPVPPILRSHSWNAADASPLLPPPSVLTDMGERPRTRDVKTPGRWFQKKGRSAHAALSPPESGGGEDDSGQRALRSVLSQQKWRLLRSECRAVRAVLSDGLGEGGSPRAPGVGAPSLPRGPEVPGMYAGHSLREPDGSTTFCLTAGGGTSTVSNTPPVELCAVLREVDLYPSWLPFCAGASIEEEVGGDGEEGPRTTVRIRLALPGAWYGGRELVLFVSWHNVLYEANAVVWRGAPAEKTAPPARGSPSAPPAVPGIFRPFVSKEDMEVSRLDGIVELSGPRSTLVTVLVNVDPRWNGVSARVAQWAVRRVVGTGLVKAMLLAKKAATDPSSSHAQRLRTDPFYTHYLIPALVAHCKSKDWDPPYVPVPSSPCQISSSFKKSSPSSNPFHRLHRKMMKKMHRKKSRKRISVNGDVHFGFEDDVGSCTDDGATLSVSSAATSQHSATYSTVRYQSIQSDVLRRMFIERRQHRSTHGDPNSSPSSPSSSWDARSPAAAVLSVSVLFPLAVLLLSFCMNSPDGPAAIFVRRHAGTLGLMVLSAAVHVTAVYAIASSSVRALVLLQGPAAAVSLAHTIRYGMGIMLRLSLLFSTVVCLGCTAYAGLAEVGRKGMPGAWMECALANAQSWMNNAASFFACTMISAEIFLFYPRKMENVEAAMEAVGVVVEKKRQRKEGSRPRLRSAANDTEDGEDGEAAPDEDGSLRRNPPRRKRSFSF